MDLKESTRTLPIFNCPKGREGADYDPFFLVVQITTNIALQVKMQLTIPERIARIKVMPAKLVKKR